MLDELACAGHEHLDSSYVAGYEGKAAFDPADDIAVLQAHGLTQDSIVIDAGAGTGVFARAIAPRCRRVIAFDPSPPMVALLRQRVSEAQVANVTVVEAGFLSYEHPGPPADFVYTRNALHQLPDFWKAMALTRLSAMVRPGGVVRARDLVFDFEPAEAATRLEEWFSGAVADASAGYTRDELATHVRTEHSTYRWLFEGMLEHAGLTVLDASYRKSVYAAYTCVRTR
jgi:FkbM family methyltransferase